MKYKASNDFYECFLGKDSDINRLGKVILFIPLILCYSVWLSLDFLFVKNE